jgi:hypothetical protein
MTEGSCTDAFWKVIGACPPPEEPPPEEDEELELELELELDPEPPGAKHADRAGGGGCRHDVSLPDLICMSNSNSRASDNRNARHWERSQRDGE